MALHFNTTDLARIQTANPLKPGMCYGWMVQTLDNEVLYALAEDGSMRRTNPLPRPNNEFNRKGRKWYPVTEIPAEAEFIGHYELPR